MYIYVNKEKENSAKREIGIVFIFIFFIFILSFFTIENAKTREIKKIIKSSDNNNDTVVPLLPPHTLAEQFDNSYTSVFMA